MIRVAVECAKLELFEKYGFDLAASVEANYVDGAPELTSEMHAQFPGVDLHRCLEHIKRRMQTKWPGPLGLQVKNILELSAFIPNQYVFTVAWQLLLGRLRDGGTELVISRQTTIQSNPLFQNPPSN